MSGLLGAFIAEVALVTYRAVTQGGTKKPTASPLAAPLPSTFVSPVIVYGALGLLPRSLSPLPALVGWGFVVATFLNLYNPGGANAATASGAALAQGITSAPPGAPGAVK